MSTCKYNTYGKYTCVDNFRFLIDETFNETFDETVDLHKNCPSWAANNECNINPGYMLVNCRKSCEV